MELKKLFVIIKQNKVVFFAVWFGIVFLAMMMILLQAPRYEATTSFLISRDRKNINEKLFNYQDLRYDYFYQLEANDSIGKIISGLVKDDVLQENLFNDYKKDISTVEKKFIKNQVKIKEIGDGYFQIKLVSHQKTILKSLSLKLTAQVKEVIDYLNTNKNNKIVIKPIGMVINLKQKPFLPIFIGSFFGGLFLAIFFVLANFYFNDERKK